MKIGQWLIAVGIVGWFAFWGALNFQNDRIFADQAVIEAPDEQVVQEDLPAPDTEQFFTMKIAPLLAKNCLECHDATVSERGLDLSTRETMLEGGRGGAGVVPGDLEESLVWDYVSHGDMPPPERPALEPEEVELLRDWIEAGAVWSGGRLDMIALTRDSRAVYQWLQRLTVPEYIETVRSVTGVDIEVEATSLLPADVRADGFTNTAYNLGVDLAHIEAFAELAYLTVQQMDIDAFLNEHAGTDCRDLSDGCLHDVIANVGKWVLRGPLDDEEIDLYKGLAYAVEDEGGDFNEAISYIVEAMLQSPRFIYRMEENREPGERVSDYELAVRMSYMIWGGPPDKELMQAAEAGELSDLEQVRAQIDRMLEDPRAIERSQRFVGEWLNVDHVMSLAPNRDRFPTWNAELARDVRQETLAFVEDVLWRQERPMWDLMNAQVTLATPRLAEHYDLSPELADTAPHYVELDEAGPERVREGLQAMYMFDEGIESTAHDSSDAGDNLNLRAGVADPITGATDEGWEWTDEGIRFTEGAMLAAAASPGSLISAVQQTNELTIEAWVTPQNIEQDGPARIITFSRDTSNRNFTLGQDGDRFEARIRTTDTSDNGLPGISSEEGTATTDTVHVVYTRDSSGEAVMYINGHESSVEQTGGDFGNWDGAFEIAVGDELSGDRPWLGTLHLAAVYDQALTRDQVQQNYTAGPRGEGLSTLEVLYHFDEGDGDVVYDHSPHTDDPLDLTIEDTSAVDWRESGLWVDGSAKLITAEPARRLTQAVRASGGITIEAWVTPDNVEQDGPARIVSLSEGTSERNFTLGQDGDRYDGRLRVDTFRGDDNGLPSLSSDSGTADQRPTHVVYTRALNGTARIFVDGREYDGDTRSGTLSNWEEAFHLVLANETSGDRGWRGTLHSVAIYSQALTDEQIGEKGQVLARYDLSEVPERGGLLTQSTVLTRGGDNASMVSRGLFVLHDILHSAVGSAPPDVDTTPVPAEPGMSNRAVSEARLADGNCNACHARFEPLAFGLEMYNGIGAYMQVDEHGNELRDDGEILFPGESDPVPYDTSYELMDILADHDRVRMNFTRKLAQFALGRPLIESDDPVIREIHENAVRNGGTYPALITAIMTSDLVQKTRLESYQ